MSNYYPAGTILADLMDVDRPPLATREPNPLSPVERKALLDAADALESWGWPTHQEDGGHEAIARLRRMAS